MVIDARWQHLDARGIIRLIIMIMKEHGTNGRHNFKTE